MDKTTVEIGNWRFVRMDSLNWQLYEHAEILKGDRKGEVDWVKRPNYFGELRNAIVYARNREFERGGFICDIDAALARFEEIDAKFLKALKKALA